MIFDINTFIQICSFFLQIQSFKSLYYDSMARGSSMFEKFKSKYREYKYAKAHLKENPIESLSILMPKGMVLLAIISFIISLFIFYD